MKRTKEQINREMSLIKGKNTSPEIKLRKALYKKGLRYRKNPPKIYGHPDILFPGLKIAVFVDGDFWHGHFLERQKEQIKTHRSYWIPKIEKNIARDKAVTLTLQEKGYTVIRVWEDEINKDLDRIVDIIYRQVKDRQNPYLDENG